METNPCKNPKDAAATTRLDMSLFPPTAVIYGSLAMVEGDLKYGGYNFREAPVVASVYYAACLRHLTKWFNGEECDSKTKVPHLASSLACLAILVDTLESGRLIDDRPPVGELKTEELLERFSGIVGHLQRLYPRKLSRYTEKKGGTV